MDKENSYWDQILNFFGFNGNFSEQEIEDQNREKQNSKIVNLNKKNNKNHQGLKLIIYTPESYGEVKTITDDLKNKIPVILNLENTEKTEAKRIIDFISGAVYSIDGKIKKIGSGVFLFTPPNVEVDGKVLNETLNQDIFLG